MTPYVFQEYPKIIYPNGHENPVTVKNAEEEKRHSVPVLPQAVPEFEDPFGDPVESVRRRPGRPSREELARRAALESPDDV